METTTGTLGNDLLTGTEGGETLTGSAGNDEIWGYAGDDLLYGDAGSDTLYGGYGNDILDGGEGANTYYFGLGDGNDIIKYHSYEPIASSNETLIFKKGIRPENVAARFTYGGLPLVITGTDDSIFIENFSHTNNYSPVQQVKFSDGTALNRAQLDALGLKDLPGVSLTGTVANDTLLGGSGFDTLHGMAGNDHIDGGMGDDTMYGEGGNDSLMGGSGDDYIRSGEYSSDHDTLDGGSGNDTLEGSYGADLFFGGAGNDNIDGGGHDSLDMDTIDGGAGDDWLGGSGGDDTYLFGRGDGKDYIFSYHAKKLGALNTLQLKADISPSDIIITRDANSLTLSITGTTDSVTISGFFGNEAEVQRVRFADDTVWNQAILEEKTTTNSIIGTSESDTLTGTSAYDHIIGLDGDDVLDGNEGDIIFGGTGNDTLTLSATSYDNAYSVSYGGTGDDTYYANNLEINKIIEGIDEGIDTIITADSFLLPENIENATLAGSGYFGYGNILDNILAGNERDNHLGGNKGNDTLIGGGGEDFYSFSAGDGQDTIRPITTMDIDHFGTIYFGEGINSSDMRARIVGTSLELTFSGLQDKITVEVFYTDNSTQNSSNPIQQIFFANEELTWDLDALMDHVSTDVVGTEGSDTLTGDAKANDMRGLAGNDTLSGQAGNDTLDGGAGMDSLIGGNGDETYIVDDIGDVIAEAANEGIDQILSSVSYTASANTENLTLTGIAAVNAIGNSLANMLTGNSSANTLDGGTGVDTLIGGAGDDTYIVDRGMVISRDANGNIIHIDYGDIVVEGKSGGIDLVLADTSLNLSENVENLTLIGTENHYASGSSTANFMKGNAGANRLWGNAGNDTLNGGGGNDTLGGGEGDDTFVFNLGGNMDTIALDTEARTGRLETLQFGAGILPTNVSVRLIGAALELSINATDKVIIESFYVNNDVKNPANPIQQVVFTESGVTWDLVNLVALLTSSDITGTPGNDTKIGTAQADKINGLAGNDTLTGLAGNDTLDGGTGNDKLIGGAGNDTYIVDVTSDTVTEVVGEGTDLIQSSVSYTASVNVENLTLTGSAASKATGNLLANVLTGNAAANVLDGLAGADTLVGGIGNDVYIVDVAGDVVTELAGEGTDLIQSALSWTLGTNVENLTLTGRLNTNATGNTLANVLTGNGGANILDGATGNDTMAGGLGNDTYLVDAAGDVITETTGQGTDLILSSITYTASTNVENLILTGTAALDATGNALANVLTGNSGANVLNGLAGADKLIGGAGDDTYVVDATGDVITELVGEGTDLVQSSVTYTASANVENLTLAGTTAINATGNALNNVLTGNAGVNTLTGAAGNDTLSASAGNDKLLGGVGADVLAGGAGSDLFVFAAGDSVLSVTGAGDLGALTGFDTVTDFSLGWLTGAQDKIDTVGTPSILANTIGTDGKTNSTLTIAGQTIKSHAIVKGMVTFDDADAYSSALTLGSMSDVAAVVQYLQANKLGNAGASVAFDASTGGIVHTFLFTQGDNNGTNNLDVLVDLVGVNANGMTTSATGVLADYIVIG